MFNESNESTIENDIELRENCFKIKVSNISIYNNNNLNEYYTRNKKINEKNYKKMKKIKHFKRKVK